MLSGLIGCGLGFALLASVGAGTSRLLLIAYQLLLGFGLGMVMPSSLVSVQNAADRRDIGAATGCILFLRSMGGAFGSTLVGALLVSGFASRLTGFGITAHINLDELHRGNGLPGVSAAMMPHVQAALAGAFHIAFMACAAAMLIGIGIALGMRDLPLRTSSADEPQREPTALAH